MASFFQILHVKLQQPHTISATRVSTLCARRVTKCHRFAVEEISSCMKGDKNALIIDETFASADMVY